MPRLFLTFLIRLEIVSFISFSFPTVLRSTLFVRQIIAIRFDAVTYDALDCAFWFEKKKLYKRLTYC